MYLKGKERCDFFPFFESIRVMNCILILLVFM